MVRLVVLVLLGLAIFAPARAAEPEEISVGAVQLPSNGPLYIAMDKGFFADEGLRVKISFFPAAAIVYSAVVAHGVDIGMTATTAATFNLAAKGGFRIIAGTTREEPGLHLNAFMVTNKAFGDGFTSLKDMQGRRIGMTTAGSSFQYYVGLFAQKYGLDMKRIQLVPLESLPSVAASFQTAQVDAAIIPAGSVARMAPFGHVLAWCGDEVAWQQGVIIASPSTIDARRDTLVRFLRAYTRGTKLYNATFNRLDATGAVVKSPDYETLLPIIATASGLKPADVDGQLPFIDPKANPDPPDILKQVAFWQDQGLVARGFDFSKIFDVTMLPP